MTVTADMPSALDALAALPVLTWLYLLLGRGAFWRVPLHLPLAPRAVPPRAVPLRRIAAIVPARDEAAVIAGTVTSLLQQDYGGAIHVIVVDDASTDGTAAAALAAAADIGAGARLTIIAGSPLPAGWTGKLWAMSQGVSAAATMVPDYLLFTDADIHHAPDNVAALVASAEAHGRDLVSYMVELPVETPAEKCLIPAFVFFFLMLYPPRWVASARAATAAAAGGCMLMRPLALERLGGLQAIRSALIDDCALARAAKQSGATIWLGLTRSARSTRGYGSWAQIGHMIARSAFYQLRHSYLLLAGTVAALCIVYVLPPLLLLLSIFPGGALPAALGAAAWLLMSASYAPSVRFYRRSPLWSLSLPAVALFYAGATVYSAMQYRLQRGGDWKGRAQDVPRARNGAT